MSEREDLSALYGPAAPYSDHKIGETITWFDLEMQKKMSATILYVCAADPVKKRPVRYIMNTEGFPAIVYSGEVIEE
jgi:hypothetical protein